MLVDGVKPLLPAAWALAELDLLAIYFYELVADGARFTDAWNSGCCFGFDAIIFGFL